MKNPIIPSPSQHKGYRLAIVLGTMVLLSCKNSQLETAPKSCPVLTEKTTVHQHMIDQYLWADYVQPVQAQQLNTYVDSSALLDDLTIKNTRIAGYTITDKWSYIASASAVDNLQKNGTYAGYGYRCYLSSASSSDCKVAFVYPNSPIASLGITRGDTIVSATDNANNTATFSYFTANTPKVVYSAILAKRQVTISSILQHTIISTDKHTIGYMVFQSFSTPSTEQLASVFSRWKAAGVDRVVLDLRYNGGGKIATAEQLAAMLVGDTVKGQIFAKLLYNRNYSNSNQSLRFNRYANALNITSVVVITSADTCSASELLVNALRPYVAVATIGSATCGKPVGMAAIPVCDKILYPISFSLFNSQNAGNYFAGIAPTCAAYDDLSVPLGTLTENSLATALTYISHNHCGVPLAKHAQANLNTSIGSSRYRQVELSGWQQQVGAW